MFSFAAPPPPPGQQLHIPSHTEGTHPHTNTTPRRGVSLRRPPPPLPPPPWVFSLGVLACVGFGPFGGVFLRLLALSLLPVVCYTVGCLVLWWLVAALACFVGGGVSCRVVVVFRRGVLSCPLARGPVRPALAGCVRRPAPCPVGWRVCRSFPWAPLARSRPRSPLVSSRPRVGVCVSVGLALRSWRPSRCPVSGWWLAAGRRPPVSRLGWGGVSLFPSGWGFRLGLRPCRPCGRAAAPPSPLPARAFGGCLVSALVGFVGSRSLPASAAPLVGRAVRAVLASGVRLVAVGCASGADRLALAAALSAAPGRVRVFAAFGPSGAGSVPVSSVAGVSAAARAGARVSWWAGGPASLPARARLARRASALVSAVAASGPGAGLVCFLSCPASRGSVRACRLAARAGLPVVVFPVGLSPASLPSLGAGGWVSAGSGVWSAAWRWAPAVALRLPGL